jgi:hypothetical protein
VAEATRALLRFTDKLLEPHEAGSFQSYRSDAPADWRCPLIRSEA